MPGSPEIVRKTLFYEPLATLIVALRTQDGKNAHREVHEQRRFYRTIALPTLLAALAKLERPTQLESTPQGGRMNQL